MTAGLQAMGSRTTPKPDLVPTTKVKKPSRSSSAPVSASPRSLPLAISAFAAQIIMVGKRAIMHQALVCTGGEGMRAKRRHRRFRRHTGVADAMGARHGAHVKTGDDILRKTGFLVDFHAVAGTHHAHIRADCGKNRTDTIQFFGGNIENSMSAFHRDHGIDAAFLQRFGEAGKIGGGIGRLDRHFRAAIGSASVDRDTGRIRAAIGHGDEHVRKQRAQLRQILIAQSPLRIGNDREITGGKLHQFLRPVRRIGVEKQTVAGLHGEKLSGTRPNPWSA
ncbi:hypothetical protein COLO4_02296 [Corchorus olitorius]|uniref:Uncharacterized protein n=1 Tax=Corchorus olitorius TaxID=93759 RepID=A0A1R3L181_9ROSI|nr:hypothetical protein COLO4_02296 [Corchorus olitorius]